MPLTDTAVKAARPTDKAYKMTDSNGLYLLVSKSGGRLWRMNYRFNDKFRTLAIGEYPAVTLLEARVARDDAKRKLANGIDPSQQKKLARIAAVQNAENTFGAVADDYLKRLKGGDNPAIRTINKNTWLLQKVVGSELRARPIRDISSAEILQVLQRVERSGRHETARRLRSVISSVYRLAITTLRAENDPTIPLIGATRAPVVKSRTAITDEKKFGALLLSIDEYDGWPTLRALLQFAVLVACRPVEARCAEWTEIDFGENTWTVPASRMKGRKKHEVPLSRQAVAVLTEIAKLTGKGRLIFPSIRSNERPMSENAMNSALRRMGYSKEEQTAHGFRSSFSTIMNERKFDYEIIEHALAHQDGSVRAIYNRAKYWEPRVQLMQDWADITDKLRGRNSDFADLLG